MAECIYCKRETGTSSNAHMECHRAAFRGERVPEHPSRAVLVTTAPLLEGFRVIETLDVVSAEVVMGINVFRDLLAGASDVLGGRSHTTQRALREARRTCLSELREEAHALGANAVIAVDLDYSEFSGGGKSMLFLVASGTAVRVEPVPRSTEA